MFVFLTTADTEIQALAAAVRRLPDDFSVVRARNPNELQTAEALDRFIADDLPAARAVVVRVLGGRPYFADGFERLSRECKTRGIPFVALPGEAGLDPELTSLCHAPLPLVTQVLEYFTQGGLQNLVNLLKCLSDNVLLTGLGYEPPSPLPRDGLYLPDAPDGLSLAAWRERIHRPDRPTVGILFYRAHWMAQNLAPIDALVRKVDELGGNPLPIFCYSLKDDPDQDGGVPSVFREYLIDDQGQAHVDVLISTLSFTVANLSDGTHTEATGAVVDLLERLDVPVLQAVLCSSSSAEWEANSAGMTPRDIAMNVVLPEFDGRINTVAISFKEEGQFDERLGTTIKAYVPKADRVDYVARLALNFARLRRTANAEKRVAILFGNYPTKNARIGNGVGLDTPASVMNLLRSLKDAGYTVDNLPEDGDALMHQLIDGCTNDEEFLTDEQLRNAVGHVSLATYNGWFNELPETSRRAMIDQWGQPLGEVGRIDDSVAIPGLIFGNVFVGIQPPRGFGADPMAIYHSPDLPPTHHYLAYYRWLRDEFGALAVLHMGKHGNLEWLPGKATALSEECYPEIMLSTLPNFYPYIINNPGEGTQAKRRAHAVIVDHLVPPMTQAETYDDLARLEQLLDEYYRMASLDPSKLPYITQQIWTIVTKNNLERDLKVDRCPEAEEFDAFLQEIDGYLCELGDAQIRDGLHIFGQAPQGEQRVGLIAAMMRLDNGEVPSLRKAWARSFALDPDWLFQDLGSPVDQEIIDGLDEAVFTGKSDRAVWTRGDIVDQIDLQIHHGISEAIGLIDSSSAPVSQSDEVAVSNRFVRDEIIPRLDRTTDEVTNTVRGLAGRFVPAGPSGAPTRGMARILPTGRNFYSIDIHTIPTETAWKVGTQAADRLIEKYQAENDGEFPKSVGIVVWGTSTMRTHGDDIAEILHLMGCRPVWIPESRRLSGIELVSLAELGRPRIDVTVRISGFFRDAFPNVVALIDRAVELVAAADEADDQNFLRRHVRREEQALAAKGVAVDQAARQARYRVFGSKPGSYGAGLLNLIDERNWKNDADLAEVYINWGSYAYTAKEHGVAASEPFKRRLSQVTVAVQNQDNREHDIFDSDDYFQFHGGMIAAIRALTGENPAAYFGDTSNPDNVRVRDLADEARRVFRSRVVNPKWIASVMRHGYKGAFEMAATVDYLFGYEATAQVIDDWMFEDVSKAYLLDPKVQEFLQEKNPWALRTMAERLIEAVDRGFWESPNPETVEALKELYLRNETVLESR
ncbi:cobaltochelatase, CobN subunit [Singulisphaera acidiphila DSM 18658]|uniref:Cobaltochelatase, CobN subunit n=1 Tax=Singulisphaera acidiphila (strain ATCC BAA-1392 / DSM 18658 / VKM B-2454 / MOB10) TaxID=886293 RepID=L0DBE5_SINAD|nr:cobaltochelatase subunit CobN [Singulisphaera acidiphila]AGA25966.1 cobaltochelatase, CobN subunit [Singulisphaera acidiphila DSM 18658]